MFTYLRGFLYFVIPAKAGIHLFGRLADKVDPRLRGGDKKQENQNLMKRVNRISPGGRGLEMLTNHGRNSCN